MKRLRLAVLAAGLFAGCGGISQVAPPDAAGTAPDGAQAVDAAPPDAPVPHIGPPARGYSAGGRKTTSAHFILYSTTGQPTPTAAGSARSAHFVHQPGILGGN